MKFYAVAKCVLLPRTNVIITKDKSKDKIIKFKNGSSIAAVQSTEETVRGHRSKYNYDYSDWIYPNDVVNEVLRPFCVEDNNKAYEPSMLYLSSGRIKMNEYKEDKVKELANELIYYDGDYYDLARLLVKKLPMAMVCRLITKMKRARKELNV